MKKIAIIGSGVLAQHMAHYLQSAGTFTIAGFYDDYIAADATVANGKILGPISQITRDFSSKVFDQLVIGIGYNHLAFRKELFEKLSGTVPFATFIHPTCYIDPSAKIGAGVIALPGCIFDMNVTVADNIFFNVDCAIAHDSQIASHNFFGPAVKLAGFVKIDQGCFIGIGTTVIDNISICGGTKTGGGAVITKPIIQPGLYAGVPAKYLKELN